MQLVLGPLVLPVFSSFILVITARFDFVLHILVFTVLLCALVRAGAKGVANYNVIVSYC